MARRDGSFDVLQDILLAFGTDAVRDLGIGIRRDVFFYLVPIAAVVADLFAPGADGQQTLQRLDLARELPGAA